VINIASTGGRLDTNGFNTTITQRIFGGGSFTKLGAGTLTLAPSGTGNDYQGQTIISGGVLQAGVSNALGNDGATNGMTINQGGTFQAIGSFATVNRGILVGTGGGTVDTNGNTLTFGGNLTGTGTVNKIGAGELIVNRINSGSLNVTAGRLVVTPRTGVPSLAASNKTAYVNGTISVDPAAGLDLKDHDLVVTFGTGPNSFADIKAQVLAGFMSPTGGITSSTSDGSQILALFDNSQIGATEWPGGSGTTIDTNSVIGKYTYFGDANIDGQVTGDDYTVIDANLNTTPGVGLEWLSGDMNLDGMVTGDDYTVIDANLGLGVGNPLSPASLSAVPEPAGLALLSAAAAMIRRRRRKFR
jgi:autotransporter-associated beta strand protein